PLSCRVSRIYVLNVLLSPQVDVAALENQVIERKTREARDKAREDSLDADTLRYAQTAELLEKQEGERRRRLNEELNRYREREQAFENRREFDLNDPEALKKDKPARVCDMDPRCGPASLQRFEGEDLSHKARQSFQRQQTHRWLETQRAQRERERADQRLAGNRQTDRQTDSVSV
uniref:RIB43A-like with coiled-coils protein 1 n=1 Tax=Callorhinchus milii TaxID=7868 RepID=A0A4W3H4C8_CALMI